MSASMTHWDRVAENTRWGRYVTDIEKRLISRAADCARGPGKAIDLGCGSGRWSKLLAERGWEMTCVDVNTHALSICARNVPSATCKLARPQDTTIQADSNSLHLALCIEVFPLI